MARQPCPRRLLAIACQADIKSGISWTLVRDSGRTAGLDFRFSLVGRIRFSKLLDCRGYLALSASKHSEAGLLHGDRTRAPVNSPHVVSR